MNKKPTSDCKLDGQPSLVPATRSAARLWRVTVEYELLVVADNEREAESEGKYFSRDSDSEPEMVTAHQVRKVEEIPDEWRQALPFGGDRDDERTCVERVTPNAKADLPRTDDAQPRSGTTMNNRG